MASPALQFAPGTLVGDRYRVEALIGQGGFGAVFRATQLNLDRPVALKVLLEALGDDGLARFQREAEIVQQLEHPNVVRLLDFGRAAGAEPFLVFELLHGQTLEEAIRAGGPLDAARAGRVAAQILKALMEAHARGIVHRDIKPANVFLCSFEGEPDFVKVLDFGIAKGADSRTLTQRGGVIGTPAYMAPEQVDGSEAGFATDLYALGLTLAEAITGRPVFEGASLVDIVREHLSPTPVPLAPAVLQSPLGPVIHRATQKAPERRYPSAREMLAHVEAVLRYAGAGAPSGGQPTSAAPLSPHLAFAPTSQPQAAPTPGGYPMVPPAPPRASRRGRGARAVVAAIGGGLGLLAVVGAVALLVGGEKKPARAATSASATVAPEAGISWLGARDAYSVIDADVNGDGVLDFVGYCADPGAALCAVDGATFRTLWRKPVRLDRSMLDAARLVASGRAIVFVDPQGVAHVLDARTGAEQGAVRLADVAALACAPAGLPGKVWLEGADHTGVLLDVTTRAATAGKQRPAACRDPQAQAAPCDQPADARTCPLAWLEDPAHRDVALYAILAEGPSGVGFGTKGDGALVAVGFANTTPGARGPRWRRPLGPGDGETALKPTPFDSSVLAGGRAATIYEDTAGRHHAVCLEAATGRTLWDVTVAEPARQRTGGLNIVTWPGVVLTATRAYVTVRDQPRLDVLDAATGRLLGGVGPRE